MHMSMGRANQPLCPILIINATVNVYSIHSTQIYIRLLPWCEIFTLLGSTLHKIQNERRSHSTQTSLRKSVVSACHMVSWYTCKCNFIYANKKGTAFYVSVSVIVLIFTKLMLAWKISVKNSWTKFPTNGIVTDTKSQTGAMTDGHTRSSLKAIFLVLHKEHPI
jgi:hypothetical protein